MEERIIKEINALLTQLFSKMKEAGYEWDADKKELKKIEQKSAWSEEDKKTINNICHIIRQYDKISKRENKPCWYIGDCLLWMQNIKDRVQPQPKQKWSEEDNEIISAITQLFEDVKKENGWNCVYVNDEEIWFSDISYWLKSLKPQNRWKPSEEQMDNK